MRGLVPNLQFFENGDHAVPLIFIRGLGTRNQTEAGDQGIAFYSDGVFAARSQGTTVMLYDLDRIEVLRGPQGTLFGRNSTGGAISLHTAKPSTEAFDATGEITAGADSLLGFRGMVNVPVTDTWALRVAGATEERDGRPISRPGNRVRDEPQVRHRRPESFRVSSMFEPTDNVSWFLAYENFHNQGTGDVGSTDFDDRVNDATAPGNLDLDSDSLRTRLDVGFGDGYTVSYIGGYAEFDQSQLYGNRRARRHAQYGLLDLRGHAARAAGHSPPTERLSGRPGVFLFEEDNSIRFDMLHGSWGFTPQDDPNGVLSTFVQPSRSLESESVYGQGTFSFTDDLRLTAGARYIDDTREDEGGRSIDCTFGLVGPLPDEHRRAGVGSEWRAGLLLSPVQRHEGRLEQDHLDGPRRVRPERFDAGLPVVRNRLEIGRAAGRHGLTALLDDGSGNLDFSRNNALLQDPEEVGSTELGVKTDFENWRLSANLFYMDFKDMQVTGAVIDPVTGQSTLTNTNAGGATIQGLELEASVAVFDAARTARRDVRLPRRDVRRVPRQRKQLRRCARPHLEPVRPRRRAERRLRRQRVRFRGQQPAVCAGVPAHAAVLAQVPARERRRASCRASARSYFDDMFLGWENRTDRPAGTLSPTDPGEKDFGVQPAYTMVDLASAISSANDQWTRRVVRQERDRRGSEDRSLLRRAGDVLQVGRAAGSAECGSASGIE